MKTTNKLWGIIGFVFVGVLGVILHFLYEFSGNNLIVAPFSAVNESTWEHLKLAFFPMFTWAIIQFFFVESSDFGA